MLYLNDVLHILKRGRYRLLNHNFLSDINSDNQFFNKSTIQKKLSLPSVVWDNSYYTKMHDSLPLQLFSLQNSISLFENIDDCELGFLLQFSLIQSVFEFMSLTEHERKFLLEVSYFYLTKFTFFAEFFASKGLKQKGNASTRCVFFDSNLLIDLRATLLSLISIFSIDESAISLNRLSTNQIEHFFGLIRIRSKFRDTIDRFLRETGNAMILRSIEAELFQNCVPARRQSFGVTIIGNVNQSTRIFPGQTSPQEIAGALFSHFIFRSEVSSSVQSFFQYLAIIQSQFQSSKATDNKQLSSKQALCYTDMSSHIRQRLIASSLSRRKSQGTRLNSIK
jgi:hypothetical protein